MISVSPSWAEVCTGPDAESDHPKLSRCPLPERVLACYAMCSLCLQMCTVATGLVRVNDHPNNVYNLSQVL